MTTARCRCVCACAVLGAAILAVTARAAAEEKAPAPPPPAYKNLRFEEDWSQPAGEDGLDALKHMELSPGFWVSTGGSIRLRYESWDNFAFVEGNDDDLLLYRAYLHTDWHFGPHWRVFLEGRFTDTTHRDLPGSRREAMDFDRGDLWNAFVEAKYPVGGKTLTARAGRFELEYGKQRLVSPLDWSNNRRLFEGALLRLSDPATPWTLDAFATRPIGIDGASLTFNDSLKHTWFSGLHYSTKLGEKKLTILEAYLFALNSDDHAPVPQDTYTVGMRIAGPTPIKNLTWEAEGAYQFGHKDKLGGGPINEESISAWMLTLEGTYTFAECRYAPWITLGVDYASGDSDRTDDSSETFNQLFPLGHAYLGFIDAVGRQNVIDTRLSAGLWPVPKKLKVWSDLHFFSRANDDDAFFNAGGAVQRPGLYLTPAGDTKLAGERDTGIELDITASYQFNRHSSILAGYGHFWDGEFLAVTGAHEDIDFFYGGFEFKF